MKLHHGTARVATLLEAFASQKQVVLHTHEGKEETGRITAVQHEDGSGHNFNVTVTDNYGGRRTLFFRCWK